MTATPEVPVRSTPDGAVVDARPAMQRRLERWLGPALELGRQGPPLLRSLIALVGPRAEVRFVAAAATAHLGWESATGKFIIGVGPAMLGGSLKGPEDLLFVIAHELVHLMRGEHTLPPGPAAIAYNLAADALNDAWLTGPAFEGFFSPTTSLPSRRTVASPEIALLLPAEAAAQQLGVVATGPETSRLFFERIVGPPVPPGAVPYDPRAWAVVHQALHVGGRNDTLTLDVAARLVLPLLSQLPSPPRTGLMLSIEAQRALEALRRALSGEGRGPRAGGRCAEQSTPEVTRARASRSLARFLRGLVDASPGTAQTWSARGLELRPADGGSQPGRRSLVEYRAGLRATPWSEGVPRGGEGPFGLSVYLDVSASMWQELPPIIATVGTACADLLSLPVMTFSIEARPVSLRELARGRLPTDAGTDFSALARDLLTRRIARAVVITDGVAAPLPDELVRALRARGVRLAVVFPGRSGTSPLDLCCPRGWKLGLGLHDRRW